METELDWKLPILLNESTDQETTQSKVLQLSTLFQTLDVTLQFSDLFSDITSMNMNCKIK